MIAPWKIFGRLGNSLFQYAFLYSYAKDTDVDLYFQDPTHFEAHDEEIHDLFSQGVVPIDMIAIHLRRGDYVDNPFYVDLTMTKYYDKAMKEFAGEQFLVFSDDIEWAKRFFIGNEFEFSEDKTELEDLNLMAGCKAIIMANSSFSWWGAYLGDRNKKVIAPKDWHPDGIDRTVCPETWKKI